VLKLYPGQLQIDLVERSAFALWQRDGKLSVIADDGAVLEPYVTRRFLVAAAGRRQGRRDPCRDFLALLARYPQVSAATMAAIFVGERRWNLRLNDVSTFALLRRSAVADVAAPGRRMSRPS